MGHCTGYATIAMCYGDMLMCWGEMVNMQITIMLEWQVKIYCLKVKPFNLNIAVEFILTILNIV